MIKTPYDMKEHEVRILLNDPIALKVNKFKKFVEINVKNISHTDIEYKFDLQEILNSISINKFKYGGMYCLFLNEGKFTLKTYGSFWHFLNKIYCKENNNNSWRI